MENVCHQNVEFETLQNVRVHVSSSIGQYKYFFVPFIVQICYSTVHNCNSSTGMICFIKHDVLQLYKETYAQISMVEITGQ